MLKSHTSPGHSAERENLQQYRWERLSGITDGMTEDMFINPQAEKIKLSAFRMPLKCVHVCVCVCVMFCRAVADELLISALRR